MNTFDTALSGFLVKAQITYAIDLMFSILPILETFCVDKTLEPYIAMTGKMVYDIIKIVYL